MRLKYSLLAAATLLAAGAVSSSLAADRPNVLFIFSDDQCFETVRAFGMTDIDTPNLDRLVEEGTTFTHAYNMGSWSPAVCVASRHMLNTGAFVWHAEQIANRLDSADRKGAAASSGSRWADFQEEGLMWSQLMEKAGYDTYFTGKWHVKADANRIFKTARNVRGGMPKQTPEGYNRPIEGQPDPWSPSDPKFGGFWEGGKHWSEVVGDDAVDFLKMAGESESPFFMSIAFNAPHDPRQAPKEYVDRYPLERIAIPENFLPSYPHKDRIDNPAKLRDEALAPSPRTEFSVKVNRQEYYAIITHMDTQVGRILDALETSGEAENTWVIFTSDHGLAVGHHGLMGKQTLYDHSVRVPLMIKAPGVAAGAKIEAPVYLQDVMPTTLELAGAEVPDHVQFRSLKPILEGKANGYEAIYGAYLKSQRSVVVGKHKLILYPNVPKALLFDLERDPREMNDLAESPASADLIRRLAARLKALQTETGDTLDLSATFPELF